MREGKMMIFRQKIRNFVTEKSQRNYRALFKSELI